ncbi:cystatin-B-like [Engraulis encrasicolus]|uniref:cystatin-B-like n=1 Tax=Engraulis encrasicolus TaxID=184585 RepID=UPI002FD0FE74
MEPVHGGLSSLKGAYPEMQRMCEKVRPKDNYRYFYPILYRMQVVAGTNYFIKVHVDEDKYVHICVSQALPCNGGECSISGIQSNKTLEDPIDYFPLGTK